MNRFNYINKNITRIKYETEHGFYSTSILGHYAIYSKYDYYRKTGFPVSKAVLYTAEDNKVSEHTIFKIKRKMEEGI